MHVRVIARQSSDIFGTQCTESLDVVFEIWSVERHTYRQTHRHAHSNTFHPFFFSSSVACP